METELLYLRATPPALVEAMVSPARSHGRKSTRGPLTVHNPSNDPYGLDGDKDGRACER